MWHTDSKWANTAGKNGADRLAQCRVVTNLQFVRNSVSVKCNKAKHNKMRYTCLDNYKLSSEWWRSLHIVCLGCYNKLPQTRCLIRNRNVFVTVLEAGSSRPGDNLFRIWWRCSSRLQVAKAFSCSHLVERARELSQSSFIWVLASFVKALLSWSNHTLMALPPTPITMDVKISTYECWRTHTCRP